MNSHWEIEFVPDDPTREAAGNPDFIGTYEQAKAHADAHHPDYQCKEIVFHRNGPA